MGLFKVDNFKLLLPWSHFVRCDHPAEITVPQKYSKEQLAVELALDPVLTDLAGKLFDFVWVVDVLFDVQVRVEAVYVVLRN